MLCCGEEAGARNLVFRLKWLQPAMKGTLCVRRLRLGWFWFLLCVLQRVVVPAFLCAQVYAFLESVVANLIGMAA